MTGRAERAIQERLDHAFATRSASFAYDLHFVQDDTAFGGLMHGGALKSNK